ncbi:MULTISPECIES: NAD(P)-dependent oxidoreductase [unclassified Chelatococcus]|uniref:NAD(P)-dependent oxidoreductase n=1 Tax=unclassified Chelatococcus TaxID=2638111 RepID=UPI001BCF4BA7|nr:MULTISPECIES: NAD(P)-dependent oxidoreductase [unclassified Chelatococcus]MBS7700910.1 NAD(P)-dependent oxidoreductase [Chelatococcus sp. YT9]MBX3555443.1 NAD(P)-dependent oxidoreductase [Chelatococcus sp.]
MNIGFIGLGRMGAPIASHLHAAGNAITVLPRTTPTGLSAPLAANYRVAESPAALAATSDIVFTCLPSSAVVADLVNGPQGMAVAAPLGFVHVDLTSGDPETSVAIARAYADRGAHFADIGMSGAPERAQAGTLTLMVGASDAVFAKIQPLLTIFSSRSFHFGGIGSGHRAKLIIAFYGMAIANATAEALTAARRFGIDIAAIHEVVSGSGMNSTTFQTMALAAMGRPGEARKLTVGSARKDVAYFVAMANEANLATTIAPATLQMLTLCCAAGHAETFVSDLAAVVSSINGLDNPDNPESTAGEYNA